MAVTTPCINATEKKHWWLTNRKIVEKYMRDARSLIATQEQSEIGSALNLLDAALAIYPRLDEALELRARCLLYLRRFKDVADMLQDYIPSLRMANNDDSGSSVSSDSSLSREGVKLLPSSDSDQSFKCFSVSDLKKKVMAGLCKTCNNEGYWRYLVLGKACCHLGLMEDAMVLLQTGKRLATAAFRRESVCWSDDSFSLSNPLFSGDTPTTPPPESEAVTQLLAHIKLLLRRRAAALAAIDAGLHSEAIRHFSKILEGRRGAPQGFLAECYMHRASANRSAGRIADSIADCNRTLALDPTSIQALETRASLFESIRCFPDSLHDLEHLKLLYNTILRDRKLAGPTWKQLRHHNNLRYREIPGKLCALTVKTQELKQRIASGDTGNVDYYSLIGLRRGCGRSELQRAHLLLCLKHKPDKATCFVERCELADERDLDSVKERAKMSALLLYRLLQKGYTNVMGTIMDEEAAEKQRKKVLEAQVLMSNENLEDKKCNVSSPSTANPSVYQGVFCRDIAVVGNLLSQSGFNRSIPVKYEALSC
ncbi:hypothetical protein AAZX31_10G014000 [Glycine max]|uniref:J domain-containing protein n=1 Tax=Glycine soja TaxID=3848 RepID=A0A445IH14_GLYSO|nr:uncharacterized protein LOC114369758 [Glycine soja]KAG5150382.1 hypothetical protein JHK84_026854 [Glycine max]KAH1136237.1 hypothetical protein GYH30_026634 [Glycine max]RZB85172.1 hypothetical protein D0Y65_025691 [Glycine soja]